MNELGLQVVSRVANNIKIWNFMGKEKSLDSLYQKYKKLKAIKMGQYGKKIKYEYFSMQAEHKNAGRARKMR